MIAAAVLALTLTVTPAAALAPAEVKARIQVEAEPTARRLEIAIEGEGRSHVSDQPFEPSDRRQTFWIPAWRHVPAGDYVVVATLYDSVGAIVARVVRQVRIVGEP